MATPVTPTTGSASAEVRAARYAAMRSGAIPAAAAAWLLTLVPGFSALARSSVTPILVSVVAELARGAPSESDARLASASWIFATG